jgi:hypothetical protein
MNCYRLDEGSCSNDAKTKLTYIYDFGVLLKASILSYIKKSFGFLKHLMINKIKGEDQNNIYYFVSAAIILVYREIPGGSVVISLHSFASVGFWRLTYYYLT